MSYKETLFFVGECLTLQHCPDRIPRIREKIRSGEINWEQLVWVSSNQMVLQAVYLQFKRADLLKELPEDLIEHLSHIHALNKKRNQEILEQTKKIIQILNKHKIHPIFLKGVGNLLDNLYEDIGERMIGDIDFLLDEKDVIRAAEILMKEGYIKNLNFSEKTIDYGRHYPRLVKEKDISGVEIHFRLISKPYDKNLSFYIIDKEKNKLNLIETAFVLSDYHQIIYNMMNVQINDKLFYSNPIYLRQIYDLFLLSVKSDPLKALQKFRFYFNSLNNYLALSAIILSRPISLTFKDNQITNSYIKHYLRDLTYFRWAKIKRYFLYIMFRIFHYLTLIIKAFYKRSFRHLLYLRLSDPKWYRRHLGSYKKMN